MFYVKNNLTLFCNNLLRITIPKRKIVQIMIFKIVNNKFDQEIFLFYCLTRRSIGIITTPNKIAQVGSGMGN